jgi:murein DD-endopeptidase MepM/ murein hydrolase activator NlpD
VRRVAALALPALALLMIAGLTESGAAQSQARTVRVRPVPAVPVRGTIARLVVVPDSATSNDSLTGVDGEAAGEPLHFEPAGPGFVALLGVPLEGSDSLEISLRLAWDDESDTIQVTFSLEQPNLRSERLRVPPSLVTYDSATRARIDREIGRALAVAVESHQTPRLWSDGFRLPRDSRITSVYGTAREYNGEVRSRHMGTDFAGHVGEPVRAAARGRVALVADFYLAGRALYLDHGRGLVTGYFHLSQAHVPAGDTVEAGQVIGRVGRTGRVTGPHLHWIARYGGITVDAMSLLRLGKGPGEDVETAPAAPTPLHRPAPPTAPKR